MPYRALAEMPRRPEPTWWDRVVCRVRGHRYRDRGEAMRCRCGDSYTVPEWREHRWLNAIDAEGYWAAYGLASRLGDGETYQYEENSTAKIASRAELSHHPKQPSRAR